MLKRFWMIAMIFLLPVAAFSYPTDTGKPVKLITDADMDSVNVWVRDTVYELHGLVFVDKGEKLIVEPGTIIKGDTGQAENSSALVVARGGQMFAVGTPCEPIIMTTILDNVDDVNDIPLDATGRGLWGGLIICGTAPINDPSGWGAVEGILPSETRGRYGTGDGMGFDTPDPMDNSGVYRYVSVRHGGTNIGEGNEINGWTFAAVGAGTEVDYVEAFMNGDDGYEWFGGTVHCTHMVAAMCNDDCFDYDEGFRGGGQFWFGVQTDYDGDNSGEHDGGGQQSGTPEDVQPWATPLISNVTYAGPFQGMFTIRDNAGSAYYNSIFTNAASRSLQIEWNRSFTADSYQRLLREQIKFYNNCWYQAQGDYAPVVTADSTLSTGNNPPGALSVGAPTDSWVEYVLFHTFNQADLTGQLRGTSPGTYPVAGHETQNYHNYVSNSDLITSLPDYDGFGVPLQDNMLDPRPNGINSTFLLDSAGAHWTGWVNPCDANNLLGYDPNLYDGEGAVNWPSSSASCDFQQVDYPGAFAPNEPLWTCGWTAIWQYGITVDCTPDFAACDCATDLDKPTKQVHDADIGAFTHFSADTVYILEDEVFIDNNEVLYVEPGTIIKGDTGQAENSKALIIARGGKAYMTGTECCPIVLTSVLDNVYDVNDIPMDATGRGLWGGILLLGRGPINDPAGWGAIEGILPSETRGRYGVGDGIFAGPADPMDNSGIYEYVSVRHGGTNIGEGNEINGWTFGAVGAGTTVDHCEAFMNGDDGYEWFGGTVRPTYMITAFCNDDCFDYDEGFRGGGQFWLGIQTDYDGDNSGEHDGGGQQSGTPEDVQPWATPLISNVTYCGPFQGAITIRDNAGGGYYNSVIANAANFSVQIEWNNGFTTDSYQRLLREQYKFYNNIFYQANGDYAPVITADSNAATGNNKPGALSVTGTTDSWVEYVLFHTFHQADLAGQLRGTSPGTYPVAGHEDQNWRNFVSDVCVFNNLPEYDQFGVPLQNHSFDPRAANIDCTYLLDSTGTHWSGWVNPCDANNLVGFDPNLYDGDNAVAWPNATSCDFIQVDYPGALDPNVPLDSSWITWSALYCYGFVGDNPCTESCNDTSCCTGNRGNVDGLGGDAPTLGDLSALIDVLFISLNPPACPAEANVDGIGPDTQAGITLGDLSALIDALFISLNPPPPCP